MEGNKRSKSKNHESSRSKDKNLNRQRGRDLKETIHFNADFSTLVSKQEQNKVKEANDLSSTTSS